MTKLNLDEQARLKYLHSCNVLDTEPEEDLDSLTKLAALLCDVPMCAISLLDAERAWLKSKQGLNVCETARDISFCQQAIQSDAVFVVADASLDPFFQNNLLVTGAPYVRAYAGMPLISTEGYALGTLCVLDDKPRQFTQDQLAGLQIIAKQVMQYLEFNYQRKQQLENLQLLETCVQNQSDIVMITEAETIDLPGPKVVFVNNAFERSTGYTIDEIIGKTPRVLQGADTDKNELSRIRESLKKWQPIRTELLNYKKNGEPFWQEIEIIPIANQTGWFTHFIGIGRDITERKKYDTEINHAAFYDALTGLPNRRLLMDRLSQTLIAKARNQLYGALLFLDLDNFKDLNDSVGHAVGDKVLAEVANRLQAAVRKEDTVARMGGDEFVVVLKDINDVENLAFLYAHKLAEKIQTAFNQPFIQDNEKYFTTCSIGVTLFNHNLGSAEDLLKRADLAMYQAKADGRNEIVFFELPMQTAMTVRAASIQQLREALDKKQFSLHYQAQLNAHNQITGAEVLLRWVNDLQESVAPNVFIKLAEESGLIVQIGEWVFTTACQQLSAWQQQAAFKDLKISVNVSVKQFMRSDFVATVLRVLKETGAKPHLLTLELTESMFVEDVEKIIDKMSQLKAKGVQLALDDFGVGYSSFMHLRRLPLSEIKIDQSFVRGITDNKVDFVITRAVIELAKNLNISVIAEGVETVAQYEILHAYGCHNYQGYLFGRPVPLAQFEAQVINHK